MGITSYEEYLAAFEGKGWPFTITLQTNNAYLKPSTIRGVETKRASTSPVICDMDTANCIFEASEKPRTSQNGFYIAGVDLWCWYYGTIAPGSDRASLLLVDRLCEQSRLITSVSTTQTTNLPTAALTRYTSGEGVVAAAQIYNAPGSTAPVISISYTNQAGTSGRTSTPMGGVFNASDVIVPIPLQQGDTGVRSVQSFQVSPSAVGVSDIGLTLYKPLFGIGPLFYNRSGTHNAYKIRFLHGASGHIPYFSRDACLSFLSRGASLGTNARITGVFYLIEG